MRRCLVLVGAILAALVGRTATAQELSAAGSTFAFPVMARWAEAYQKEKGVHVVYEPIGSSAGIIDVRADVVDFGVSDAPMVDAQLLRDGLIQVPLVIGAIVRW